MLHRCLTYTYKLTAPFLIGFFSMMIVHQAAMAQDANRQEIENIVREYLLENPEILLDIQAVLEARQQEQLAARQKKTLIDNRDLIYASENQIEIGDPNASIMIVEFFDYNCSFCKRAMSDMEQLIKANKNVRFILKEFPVLGDASVDAHRASLAFTKLMPEKSAQFHIELLAMNGPKDGARAVELAVSMGADDVTLRTEMEDPSIAEAITQVYSLADNLGINGTPSYIIGEEVIFGAVGYDQLAEKIKQLAQ